MCGFFYPYERTLALGLQLKVTRVSQKDRRNTWEFSKVRGYERMPLVAWCVDTQSGWVFNGTTLNERKTTNLEITLGGKNAKLALSGPTPLSMNKIIEFLKGEHVAGNRDLFEPYKKEYLSWQFSGSKAHSHLKERIGIHLYMTHVDQLATFAKEQNGSVDVDAGKPTDTLPRKQFKTARMVSGQYGLHVNLRESAGQVDGKPTTARTRPMPSTSSSSTTSTGRRTKHTGGASRRPCSPQRATCAPRRRTASRASSCTCPRSARHVRTWPGHVDGRARVLPGHAGHRHLPLEAKKAAGHMLLEISGRVLA